MDSSDDDGHSEVADERDATSSNSELEEFSQALKEIDKDFTAASTLVAASDVSPILEGIGTLAGAVGSDVATDFQAASTLAAASNVSPILEGIGALTAAVGSDIATDFQAASTLAVAASDVSPKPELSRSLAAAVGSDISPAFKVTPTLAAAANSDFQAASTLAIASSDVTTNFDSTGKRKAEDSRITEEIESFATEFHFQYYYQQTYRQLQLYGDRIDNAVLMYIGSHILSIGVLFVDGSPKIAASIAGSAMAVYAFVSSGNDDDENNK